MAGGTRARTIRLGAGVPSELIRPPCHLELIVPARDEARRLPHTLIRMIRYLERQPYQASIVVVDNGSVDRTVDLARHMRSGRVALHVTGCAQPGKGAAVRWGILTSSARFVGYLDADLATPIETLDLVMPLLAAGCQAVAGSRQVGGATLAEREPGQRRLGGLLFKAVAHRVLPAVADSQCGFKVFDGEVARAAAAKLSLEGFAFDVELLHTLAESGVQVTEIPVVWSHQQGSTLHALRDGRRAVADVLGLTHRRGY